MITSPAMVQLLRGFLNETIRMALASKLVLFWLATSASILLVCSTVRLENVPSAQESVNQQRIPREEARRVGDFETQADGTPVIDGQIKILFGTIRIPWSHFRGKAALFLESLLGFFLADWAGLLLAIVFTGGLLPEFLRADWWNLLRLHQKSTALMLVMKTISILLLSLGFASLTTGICWLALNLGTGTWHPQFLWSIPMLCAQLMVFYPISVFLAVWTRSTPVAITGTIAFWGLCWLMNHARMTFALPETVTSGSVVEVFYWLLPKPIDFSLIMADLTETLQEKDLPHAWKSAWQKGWIQPLASLTTSLLFSVLTMAAACHELRSDED